MRGDYAYAPLKLVIFKLVDGQLHFLDGKYEQAATLTIAFKNGLS